MYSHFTFLFYIHHTPTIIDQDLTLPEVNFRKKGRQMPWGRKKKDTTVIWHFASSLITVSQRPVIDLSSRTHTVIKSTPSFLLLSHCYWPTSNNSSLNWLERKGEKKKVQYRLTHLNHWEYREGHWYLRKWVRSPAALLLCSTACSPEWLPCPRHPAATSQKWWYSSEAPNVTLEI